MKTIKIIIFILLSFEITTSQIPLENTLRIRINEIELDDNKVSNELSALGLTIERRMLPVKASYLFGNRPIYKSSDKKKINRIIEAEKPLLRTYVVSYEGNLNPEKFATKIEQNSFIEIAEPIYLSKTQGYIPNDTYIQNQEDALELIKAFEAWEISKGSEDVVIAISDNGIQQTHEDLINNIAINTGEIPDNGIDDDENGYIDDYNGYNFDGNEPGQEWSNTHVDDPHGTKVAGIAGAEFDNNLGVAGIGGKSKIFPLRIGSVSLNNSTRVLYDYESIIYAAVRGVDVINCSWGTPKTYSDIEQSAIDYAVANDVIVVAAAGNVSALEKYYPAGYDGVLGVGAVTAFDSEANGPKGAHLDIHAPSSQNYSTDIDEGQGTPYVAITTATSFSAPVVSGAAAILRAHRPELSALEAIEFIRQASDDISDKRTFYKKIITGRLNMLKMLTIDPMSIPGIRVEENKYFDVSGAESEKFEIGDTVFTELVISNVLGSASDLDFKLSVGFPEYPILEFIDSELKDINISRNETVTIGKFKFVVVNESSEYLTMRLDITGQNDYKDFVLFDFNPKSEVTTFENEKIKFSISDVGTFGFESGAFLSNYKEGIGFINKDYGNGLYRAGIFAIEDDVNVITSLKSVQNESEFFTLKPFKNPKNTSSIFSNDPFRDTRIEIQQTIELPKNLPWVRIKVDVTDSAAFGSQYTVGYEFDWDIGLNPKYKNNTTRFLPNARPSNITSDKFAAISTNNVEENVSFGVAMYSEESDAKAQAAGYTSENPVNTNLLINAMQSGKTIITEETNDIYNLVGVRFTDSFDDYETKTCYLCVSTGDDNTDLAANLKECASGTSSVELDKNIESISFRNNTFEINNISYINTEIYDLNGRLINTNSSDTIELTGLEQGVYLVRFEFEDSFIVKKIAITN